MKLIFILIMSASAFLIGCGTTTRNVAEVTNVDGSVPEAAAAGQQGEQRIVAFTKEVFVRDTSHPQLGEAYRDPSGLIWGDVIATSINQYDANKACKKIGARLPTLEEFKRLRTSLQGYTHKPFNTTVDGKEVLPGFSNSDFWTSSTDFSIHGDAPGGRNGDIGYHRPYSVSAVRCVADH